MARTASRTADRIQAFIGAIDAYEPRVVSQHADAYRTFARFVSRIIDGRYLERHPIPEILTDLEHLMSLGLERAPDEIKVRFVVAEQGGGERGVLMTCTADQPFLYSTVRLALDHLKARGFRSINAEVPIGRDAKGRLRSVAGADATGESYIWIEVEGEDLAQRKQEIERYVHDRLQAAQQVVRDHQAMTDLVRTLAERSEQLAKDRPDHRLAHEDNARFLRWLLDNHFVFLGTRYLPVPGVTAAGSVGTYGVGRFNDWRGISVESADSAVHEAGAIPPFLWIRKSHSESWVYRPGRIDHVLVQCYDPSGRPAGLLVIAGLFSFPALAKPRTEVPLLDRVIAQLFTQLQAQRGSHRYRTIRNAFNSLPLEYLFTLQMDDVRQLVERVLDAEAEQTLQVHFTIDELQSSVFVFVALPRSYYSDDLRADIRALLKARLRASSVDDGVYASDVESVTFHYFLTGAQPLSSKDEASLRDEIEQLASPWAERLYNGLRERHGVEEARRLHGLYSEAFSARYQESTSIGRAVNDIEIMEAQGGAAGFDCDIYRESVDATLGVTRIRMFESQNILLSDILPILDNFGLIVIDQYPTTIRVPERPEQVVATFRIGGARGLNIDLMTRRNRLRDAIRAVVSGAMENDETNRLLLMADLSWTYVCLVRAYQHYARQLGLPYGAGVVRDALMRHPAVVRSLTEFFRSKFDPEIEGLESTVVDERRHEVVERARRVVLSLLDSIDDLTSDQVLRLFYSLIEGTVRTNFYARDAMAVPHIALKFDPARIERIPEPRPYREIYVHHPLVAGLHLRGGPIARGGIRWSDRTRDFRTEVLGLATTQNLKNSIIVPRGAKGAFILRRPPTEPGERRTAADELYKIFIRGLLDITDNLVDDKPVTPPNVLCYDPPDHYLVVAADKGTAHLSDTANGIAEGRGFWLKDAFASGGSHGYDHKKEAITARGAWECCKRHFREMGFDPEVDVLRVCGIGDMSGDVFGNGLLRSKSVKLVAAFDHRHIFIDPDPDPEQSFAERLRLFKLPRSSWEDYSKELLSKGGGIFPRSAKAIRLSAEARRLFGTDRESISGQDLVKAILCLDVDLLWNGGIGTYIKAAQENHIDVGDPPNDAVRVDAPDVRAKVIVEGGNLGITAAGRVELAARGVRLNTDAVDNSGGVDMSDHEVNLKILLERPLGRKDLTRAERDELLVKLGPDVTASVLSNNWVQSRMLSLDQMRSQRDLGRFQRAVTYLSAQIPFRRRDMHLPSERLLAERAQKGLGMYRPELAVLAANAKLHMRRDLAQLPVGDMPYLAAELVTYFPPYVVEHWRDDVLQHPLARNIANTVLTNRIIGDAGATWLTEAALATGRDTRAVVLAYLRACAHLGADALKAQLQHHESKLATSTEYLARLILEDAIEATTHWLLRHAEKIPASFEQAFATCLRELPSMADSAQLDQLNRRSQYLISANLPATLAERLATLDHVDELLDIAFLSATSDEPVVRAGGAFYAVGESTGLLQVVRACLKHASAEGLDRPARLSLQTRLRGQLVEMCRHYLRREANVRQMSEPTQQWLTALQRDLQLLSGNGDLSTLVVAMDRIERSIGAAPR